MIMQPHMQNLTWSAKKFLEMKTQKLVFVFLFVWSAVNAQLSGGGDLNPDLKAPKESQEKWMDLRVGLSVHWGPSSLGGEEISWSRDRIIPKEIHGLVIHNRKLSHHNRAEKLAVWISDDGQNWMKYWSAKSVQDSWDIPFTSSSMGATISEKKSG